MAQQQRPLFCSNCGAPIAPPQSVCAMCGFNLAPRVSGAYHPPLQAQAYPAASQANALPSQEQQEAPAQSPRRQGLWRIGCVLLLFFILATLGIAYIGAPVLGLHFPTVADSSQPPISTISLNTSLVYAGMNVTIVQVQRADSFLDDTLTHSPGVLRVQVRAHNTTQIPTNLLYTTITSLVLPGGKIVKPSYVNADVGLLPDVTRTSVIDFAVPTATPLDQLIFRLGRTREAQMDIPLTPHPDLARYEPKTTSLNSQLQYLGLDWMLVSATTQWSIDGSQAARGMEYITMQLKVNNTLSQTAITGSAYEYARLKMGDNTVFTPVATTLPVSFPAGANGQTGSVTFLVPQNATALTFLLIATKQSGFNQATTTIQIS